MQPFIHRMAAAALVACAACVATGGLAQEPPRYRVRDLNALPGLEGTGVSALNNRGDFTLLDSTTNRSYLWRGGKLHDLGLWNSAVFDLNDRVEVVGAWDMDEAGYVPFLWRHGRLIIEPALTNLKPLVLKEDRRPKGNGLETFKIVDAGSIT